MHTIAAIVGSLSKASINKYGLQGLDCVAQTIRNKKPVGQRVFYYLFQRPFAPGQQGLQVPH